MKKINWWAEPEAGDIVWCHFPDNLFNPQIKTRPALLLQVLEDDDNKFYVKVVYGTNQSTTELYKGEFAIYKDKNKAAYE